MLAMLMLRRSTPPGGGGAYRLPGGTYRILYKCGGLGIVIIDICSRIASGSLKLFAHAETRKSVELKQLDCGTAISGASHDARTFKVEMIGPMVASRMKELNNLASLRIHGREIGTFLTITVETSQREIFRRSRSAMLHRNNMIRLVKGEEDFRDKTVFATALGAAANHISQRI